METWKDIPGYEGSYQISNTGRVRSLDRRINMDYGATRLHKGSVLTPQSQRSGHMYVSLKVDGIKKHMRIHRLVLLAFVGKPKKDEECLHLDGNPRNNNLVNLKWGTRKENMQQSVAHGTHGSLHASRKRKVFIQGVEYESVNKAARLLNLAPSSVHHRCTHSKYGDWSFGTNQDTG